MNYPSLKSPHATKDNKELLAKKYLEGDYDQCLALVIEQLNSIQDYINFNKTSHLQLRPKLAGNTP